MLPFRVLILVLLLPGPAFACPNNETPVVLHAEPPVDNALARIIVTRARVGVRVNQSGHVIEAALLEPSPPFVGRIAEEAARKWLFALNSSPQSYNLAFVFDGVGQTDISRYQQVTQEDPLTLKVRHFDSIVSELTAAERQDLARQRCPVHHSPLAIDIVRVRYGLPRGFITSDPQGRAELRKAQRFWRARERLFPRANVFVGAGCIVHAQRLSETGFCMLCRRARQRWIHAHPEEAQYE